MISRNRDAKNSDNQRSDFEQMLAGLEQRKKEYQEEIRAKDLVKQALDLMSNGEKGLASDSTDDLKRAMRDFEAAADHFRQAKREENAEQAEESAKKARARVKDTSTVQELLKVIDFLHGQLEGTFDRNVVGLVLNTTDALVEQSQQLHPESKQVRERKKRALIIRKTLGQSDHQRTGKTTASSVSESAGWNRQPTLKHFYILGGGLIILTFLTFGLDLWQYVIRPTISTPTPTATVVPPTAAPTATLGIFATPILTPTFTNTPVLSPTPSFTPAPTRDSSACKITIDVAKNQYILEKYPNSIVDASARPLIDLHKARVNGGPIPTTSTVDIVVTALIQYHNTVPLLVRPRGYEIWYKVSYSSFELPDQLKDVYIAPDRRANLPLLSEQCEPKSEFYSPPLTATPKQ